MNRFIAAAALICGLSLVPFAPSSAAARHYDCSKPGNANKAVCKSAAANAAVKAAAPAKAPKPSKTKVSSTTTTKTVTQRNYDCSKAGNKNKAVCKAAATPSKPVVKQTTVETATRHYDCTKPGNANKEQCKVSAATHQTTSKSVAERKPAAAPAARPTARRTSAANDNNPAGATAQCKDGTYSHAKERRGACSHHGGVAKWL
jgi:hypothetical protein